MVIKIGVLELQGGYALHHNLLKKIGLSSLPVKSINDFEDWGKGLLSIKESTKPLIWFFLLFLSK